MHAQGWGRGTRRVARGTEEHVNILCMRMMNGCSYGILPLGYFNSSKFIFCLLKKRRLVLNPTSLRFVGSAPSAV